MSNASLNPRPDVLVVAATAAEARYVPEGLPLVVTGIGKTPSAARTARALAEFEHVDDLVVVNLGTAGALKPGVEGLFGITRVTNHDMNAEALRALGYDPQETLQMDPVPGLPSVSLVTGDLFVTDPVVRDRLAEQAELVDMEGYAVAWTAAEFGRDVVMVKHVSDQADDSAWEWADVVDNSAKVLAAWLEEFRDTRG